MFSKARKIFFILFLLILISCLSISCSSNKKTNDGVIAGMGNEAIEMPLFKKEMSIQSYDVCIYFYGQYGVKLDNDLESWKKEYKEGTPLKMLKERSLEESKKAKATLVIAKEKGLIKTVNYNDIQKYNNESLKNAFKISIDESKIDTLPIYDRDVFLRFMEIVKYELKKNIRNGIRKGAVENYVENHNMDYFRKYIRILPKDEADRNSLVNDIIADSQKFNVIKDLMLDDKYNEIINQKINSVDIKINQELFNSISIDQSAFQT